MELKYLYLLIDKLILKSKKSLELVTGQWRREGCGLDGNRIIRGMLGVAVHHVVWQSFSSAPRVPEREH